MKALRFDCLFSALTLPAYPRVSGLAQPPVALAPACISGTRFVAVPASYLGLGIVSRILPFVAQIWSPDWQTSFRHFSTDLRQIRSWC